MLKCLRVKMSLWSALEISLKTNLGKTFTSSGWRMTEKSCAWALERWTSGSITASWGYRTNTTSVAGSSRWASRQSVFLTGVFISAVTRAPTTRRRGADSRRHTRSRFGVTLQNVLQRLIVINRIQNKSVCVHNICVCTVYIYYVYINTHTCMYIFQKTMLC